MCCGTTVYVLYSRQALRQLVKTSFTTSSLSGRHVNCKYTKHCTNMRCSRWRTDRYTCGHLHNRQHLFKSKDVLQYSPLMELWQSQTTFTGRKISVLYKNWYPFWSIFFYFFRVRRKRRHQFQTAQQNILQLTWLVLKTFCPTTIVI